MPDPIRVPLVALSRNPAYQPRVRGIHRQHVAALMSVPESWPVLIVVEQHGQYIPGGYWHRARVARAPDHQAEVPA